MSSSLLKTAYTLLPPPLASLPAKYWTAISLWMHSYSVGKTFAELVDSYAGIREVDAPAYDEAFIIGFLHDFGQKLVSTGASSSKRIIEWVEDRLERLGYDKGEARRLSRFLYANPAENIVSPTYDRDVWVLLWLADRLHGASNIFDLVAIIREASRKLEYDMVLKLVNVTIPQPFLRALITRKIYDSLREEALQDTNIMIPLSTPIGVTIITDDPKLSIELDWDNDIRPGFDGNGLIPGKTEDDLKWCSNCCIDNMCREICGKKDKPKDCRERGYKKRDCDEGAYPGRKGNSYKTTLIYYGVKHKVEGAIYLPEAVRDMFRGVGFKGVRFLGGEYKCPLCGLSTPTAFPVDYIQTFINNVTPEQWTRAVFPANINQLMQMKKGNFGVDPLCLGDILLRARYGKVLSITISLNTPTPLTVLEDVGIVMYRLIDYVVFSRDLSVLSSVVADGKNWEKTLENISFPSGEIIHGYFIDAFTATVFIPYINPPKNAKPVDEWVRDISVAGVLVCWGFYPLSISEAIANYGDRLLSYYRGMRPLYNYTPADREVGKYTPYVALTMMSLPFIRNRREAGKENTPTFLEVLDYPPEYSPALLQYSAPHLYSAFESLKAELEG